MKLLRVLLPVAVLAAAVAFTMQSPRPRCSGFSFAHRGGDCVVWYARSDDSILDLLIAPRNAFAACYQAGSMRLKAGDRVVEFGSMQHAYICEGSTWRVVPLNGLQVSDLPRADELQNCASTAEVARRVLGQ